MHVVGLEFIDQNALIELQCTVAFEKDRDARKTRQRDAGFDWLIGRVEGKNVCDTAVFACQNVDGIVLEGVFYGTRQDGNR